MASGRQIQQEVTDLSGSAIVPGLLTHSQWLTGRQNPVKICQSNASNPQVRQNSNLFNQPHECLLRCSSSQRREEEEDRQVDLFNAMVTATSYQSGGGREGEAVAEQQVVEEQEDHCYHTSHTIQTALTRPK